MAIFPNICFIHACNSGLQAQWVRGARFTLSPYAPLSSSLTVASPRHPGSTSPKRRLSGWIFSVSRIVASCSFWLWGSVFLSLNLHISCCTKQWSAPVFIRFPFLNGIVPTPSSEVKPWTQLCVASQPSFRLEELNPHHHSASGLGVPHNCGFCLITIYYYYYYLCFYAFISGSQKSQFCFWHGYALCFLWRYFFLIVMYFK